MDVTALYPNLDLPFHLAEMREHLPTFVSNYLGYLFPKPEHASARLTFLLNLTEWCLNYNVITHNAKGELVTDIIAQKVTPRGKQVVPWAGEELVSNVIDSPQDKFFITARFSFVDFCPKI